MFLFLYDTCTLCISYCNSLQCLYCEHTFRDHPTLKDHMRKKQHKKINPQNKVYDRFYVINYLELGKSWEQVQVLCHQLPGAGQELGAGPGSMSSITWSWARVGSRSSLRMTGTSFTERRSKRDTCTSHVYMYIERLILFCSSIGIREKMKKRVRVGGWEERGEKGREEEREREGGESVCVCQIDHFLFLFPAVSGMTGRSQLPHAPPTVSSASVPCETFISPSSTWRPTITLTLKE